MSPLLLILLIHSATTQDYSTPSSLQDPRVYNNQHHDHDNGQYLKEISPPEPTKQGPVLFPNDAPPPPKPPLIVTARPLAEAIARSEQSETNTTYTNSIDRSAKEEEVNHPEFSDRADYSYATPGQIYVDAVTGKPIYDFDYNDYKHPYEAVLKKSRVLNLGHDHRYDDYEEQTILPPIYKALSDHAQKNVLKIQNANKHSYNVKKPEYGNTYSNNRLDRNKDDDLSEDDQNANYAFSYTVRDKQTGDDFSHTQKSSGSATNGEYRVRLPDGRMQIVSYTADENGYKADVRYDDEVADNRIDNHRHNSPKVISNHIPRISEHRHVITDHNQRVNAPIINYPRPEFRPRVVNNNQFNHAPQIHEPISRLREYGTKISGHNPRVHEYSTKISDHGPLINYNERIIDQNQRITEYNQRIDDRNQINTNLQNTDHNVITNHDFNYEKYKTNDVNYKNDYKVNDDYSYDHLKDYNDDYSTEFDGKQYEYQPHQSKFNQLVQNPEPNKNVGVIFVPNIDKSTVRPSLESLRNLFLNKIPINNKIPVQLNVPSTTQSSITFDSDENVVIIGTPKPNLYTNTKNSDVTTQQPTVNYQTPSSYLESTIATLKNRNIDYSGSKPVLSGSFLERINKYLTF